MNCERAIELIFDSLVAPLDADAAHELHEHIESCADCRAEAARYRRLWRNLETVAVPARSGSGLDALNSAVADEFGVELSASTDLQFARAPTRRPVLLRIAASLALLVAGSLITLGIQNLQQRGAPADDGRSEYIFIMTNTIEPADQAEQVQAEFDAWIDDLVARDVIVTGIGLASSTPAGTPPGGPLMDEDVSGFIVIRAADDAEARRIALSSPVIAYGGFIEIREVSDD